MQSPLSPTFNFREAFDVTKPHRLIDKRISRGMLYKKGIVLAKHSCDLTAEAVAFLKEKGYTVYDDAEALRNDDLPIWREAVEAKKAGKPYDKDDWNKFLAGYNAIATGLTLPFIEEFTDNRNHPLASYILLTKAPSATAVNRIRSFFTEKLFPLLDPVVFGLLANLKLVSGGDILNYDAIHANLDPQQHVIAMDDFNIQVANSFIKGLIPQGPTATVESFVTARLRCIQDYIGHNYIHTTNQLLIAISFIMSFIMTSCIFGLTAMIVFFVGCAIVAFFMIPTTAPTQVTETKDRPACISPHRRKKIATDAAAAAAAAAAAIEAPAAETKDRPAFIPPHVRKKIAAAAAAAATDAPAAEIKDRSKCISPHRRKKIAADAAAAAAAAVTDAPAAETKVTESTATASVQLKATATAFAPPGQQKKGTAGQKQSSRTPRSKARGTIRVQSIQPPVPVARSERPVLDGWGDMENFIRQDDLKTRRENEAKAEAMKDMEPGVWAEKYASRSSKPIAEKKAGDN
ncbi:uncharacterized protein N0V89_009446 [Didymosphaeria variabile]|uniref:Uncharacterized protein n=1 Tax=Didymosphaeria variabile TaxID=1932322 RepID=A0A9W9C862_9PLEO|nr:uncharacterized protein N0V89_009446 [Didymosphaeria variabile]KAJ4348074.1 hypothetical protein N0V89_009446 [Didymosphaeria variabile]